jgi:dTDP-4-dehydrorhamnose 3,5-epimerase
VSETFCSVSEKNVIRGIHFQLNNPQAKIVTVLCGAVLDYIVDLRPESDTFKQWTCVELSEDNHLALFVPRGFGHGFCSMREGSIMFYMCDGAYDKETDTGIIYNDSELNIIWPTLDYEIHSERDLGLMSFAEYMSNPMKCKQADLTGIVRGGLDL